MIQLCSIHHDFAATQYTQGKEHVFNDQSLATMLTSSWRSSEQHCDFVALVWPIQSLVITTSSAVIRGLNFLSGPSVGFKR